MTRLASNHCSGRELLAPPKNLAGWRTSFRLSLAWAISFGFLATFFALWASFMFTPSFSVVFFSLDKAALRWNMADMGSFFTMASGRSLSCGRSFQSSSSSSLSSSDSWSSMYTSWAALLREPKLPGCLAFMLPTRRLAAGVDLFRASLVAVVEPPVEKRNWEQVLVLNKHSLKIMLSITQGNNSIVYKTFLTY